MKIIIIHSIVLLLSIALCSATTIIVDPAGKTKTITAGIRQASTGDTVRVTAGTYREGNIIISKSLVLQGEGKPVVDGEFKTEIFTSPDLSSATAACRA